MRLDDLRPAPGSTSKRKRVGRGIGSGMGASPRLGFEGGQTPLHRRLPQRRGFRPLSHKEYALVNVAALDCFDAGTEVTPELLISSGLIKTVKDGVKVLGNGDIGKALTVRAHKFSKTAEDKLKAAGGTAEVI